MLWDAGVIIKNKYVYFERDWSNIWQSLPSWSSVSSVTSCYFSFHAEMLNFKYRMSGNFHSRIVFLTPYWVSKVIPARTRNLWLNTDLQKHVIMEQVGIAVPLLDLCFRCNVLSFNELLESYTLLQGSELVRAAVYSFWGYDEYIRTLEANICVDSFVKFLVIYRKAYQPIVWLSSVCRWNSVVTSLKV